MEKEHCDRCWIITMSGDEKCADKNCSCHGNPNEQVLVAFRKAGAEGYNCKGLSNPLDTAQEREQFVDEIKDLLGDQMSVSVRFEYRSRKWVRELPTAD